MKAAVIILLCAFCSIECGRKITTQLNKHANIDFINMESGGQGYRPAPASPGNAPAAPAPAPAKQPAGPAQPTTPKTLTPVPTVKPAIAVTTKPIPVAPVTAAPIKPVQPQQPKPNQGLPNQMDLKPVQPGKPTAAGGVTTPGPGSVKQLVNFYDSQGKASAIRPYSYSQAVKQGK